MSLNIPGKGLAVDYLGRLRKTPLPTQLVFFVTARCNYQCSTCFYWRNLKAIPNELSLDEIARISASLSGLSRLLISGGEPFLRPDLADICELFYRQNHIQGIDLPTNGSLTEQIIRQSELILKKCARSKLVVGVSLDGLAQTNDAIRQKPGSFQAALNTLRALAKLKQGYPHLSLHIITVVSQQNISQVAELIKFLQKNCDIDSFGPNPLRGNPKDKTLLPPSAEQWLNLFEQLTPYYKYFAAKRYKSPFKRYLTLTQRRYLDKITAQVLAGRPLPFTCRAGEGIAVLEPNADLRLCELTRPIGNLRAVDYDFKKLWHSAAASAARRQIQGCTCTHGCFLSPSIALSPFHLLRSLFPI